MLKLTKDDLGIRDFYSGDECIVQKWRDEFPYKDGTEGCRVDVGDVYYDAQHLLVYLKDVEKPIGTIFLKGTNDVAGNEKPTEVILAVGDFNYMNKEVLYAMKDCVTHYMEVCYPEAKYVILFDGKSVDQVLNPYEEGGQE